MKALPEAMRPTHDTMVKGVIGNLRSEKLHVPDNYLPDSLPAPQAPVSRKAKLTLKPNQQTVFTRNLDDSRMRFQSNDHVMNHQDNISHAVDIITVYSTAAGDHVPRWLLNVPLVILHKAVLRFVLVRKQTTLRKNR